MIHVGDEFETSNLTLALWRPEAEGVSFAANTAGIALRDGNVLILHRRYAPLGGARGASRQR